MGKAIKKVTGAVKSVFGGDAASDARSAARANARAEAAETEEAMGRMQAEQGRTQALARARAAASGAEGATSDIYMTALEKAGQEELDWLKEVGVSRYNQQIAAGDSASSVATSNFFGNLVNTGFKAFSLF